MGNSPELSIFPQAFLLKYRNPTFKSTFVPRDGGVKLVKPVKSSLAYVDTTVRPTSIKSMIWTTNNGDMIAGIRPPVMSPTEDAMFYRVYIKEKDGKSYCNIWKQDVLHLKRHV